MASLKLPDDCAKQWEILVLLISSEEKKIGRTNESEVDTMDYFLRHEGVRKIMHQWLEQMHYSYAKKKSATDTALKDDEISYAWRQKGNVKFRNNTPEDIKESYKCYNNSVLYASQTGEMYPLALGNRSASLVKMRRYKKCLSDIELALTTGYPSQRRHKLLLRRAECYVELGRRSEARTALRAGLESARANLTPSQHTEIKKLVRSLEKKLAHTLSEPEEEDTMPPYYLGENPNFVSASNALELRRSDFVGRYVAARESTRRGDVLFVEEPYAWVALPGPTAVCEHCCITDINPIPCSVCSRVVFCSTQCREAADSYHRWECVGAQSDLFKTIGIAHLALRVLLLTCEIGFPCVPTSEAVPTTAIDLFNMYSNVDDIQIYDKDTHPFYRMFNLVTNFDKMNNPDYIQYAVTATMLMIYLDNFTPFFQYLCSKVPCTLSPEQIHLFAAALILRSLGQLVCNGHAALSLATVDEGRSTSRTVSEMEIRRATAIYPSAAMMNHSCDSNITTSFYGRRLIVRSARETPAGFEVTNCYGWDRARDSTPRRRRALRKQYMFTCNCEACVDTKHSEFTV